uniref:RNA helicase n=1 Tax=Meloidogyne javanica TaxID=6303 RepID=A0A915LXQ0_MELJA
MPALGEALKRRKFIPKTKGIDELIQEQQQINHGPVVNAKLPVRIIGGDGNGESHIIRSFNDVKINAELRNTLNSINYFEPTDVQKCVIPLIQNTTNDILCLAATGSGKSGSFLIPIINRLQKDKLSSGFCHSDTLNNSSPVAIIVAHTKELVEQLYKFAKTLAYGTQVGVAYARGQMPFEEGRRQLANGCDILVITPGRLQHYLNDGWIFVDGTQFVVIDEADNATLTEVADFVINDFLKKDCYKVIVGKPNQAVSHVHQRVLKVDDKYGYAAKFEMARIILRKISTCEKPKNGEHFCYNTQRTLIFLNDARSCDRLAIKLSDLGYRAMSTSSHREMEQRYRAVSDFKEGKWHILIGTDIIARGMNFPKVKNIIIYELPPIHRYQEYVHRVGRTGRIGTEDGCAYIFFDPRSRNDEMQAEFLIEQLENSQQQVPEFLRELQKSISDARSRYTNECSSTNQNSIEEQLEDKAELESEIITDKFANVPWPR